MLAVEGKKPDAPAPKKKAKSPSPVRQAPEPTPPPTSNKRNKDKPAASSEGTKGATKRNKGKQADIEIDGIQKLNKKEMIVVIQDEIPNPRKPPSLNKMTEQQIVAYVAERLGKKKQRRNKNTQPSLLTA